MRMVFVLKLLKGTVIIYICMLAVVLDVDIIVRALKSFMTDSNDGLSLLLA